ncbi:1-(5-phosphoribosyl)-5-[(5-phosphoribosylamino)methylideneamino]imidazole-4-carboxamide isomerase [Psychrosphaera aestuarii]|uniref:1-(5-phosphoribosyl)-5-[(5- phosphoribosylamino)methylideneamino]imidazole-4- carboxamide isomerase n=1 Tax=Psychrosphaera aestuarii TaxID=1266052 RepID=UPI001B31F18C|nr:1-(5-phosphoribosyl)-5-[(5-phosphoribosylamino)methylideneamino]imidazole-4-carboxamide isomerase [Psychrosphaera aestuarii]
MIIPAIDLIEGSVVRLYQGDYGQKTEYKIDPVELVKQYASDGAEWLHIVDLTGAKDTTKRQLTLIKQMVDLEVMKFQAGGGIRTEQDIIDLFEIGVTRVVIGSLAVNNAELVMSWVEKYGAERIVLALDVNIDSEGNKYIATHGWQESSGVTLESVVEQFLSVGLKHVLCTDISKDGTLQGPNQALYKTLAQQYPQISWQASGGISSLADIELALTNIKGSGLNNDSPSGVILGRSLLEGKFELKQAIAL